MKLLLMVICAVLAAEPYSRLVHDQFEAFKVSELGQAANGSQYIPIISFQLEHNKNYTTKEQELFRFKVFMNNLHEIYQNNIDFEQKKVSFRMGVNPFTDMFAHEVNAARNGLDAQMLKDAQSKSTASTFIEPEYLLLPDTVNWEELGAVTPVKDQGDCGSCWAFSATGALEGQVFRGTGKLIPLSEQNLVDCTSSFGNNGCRGGMMDNAYIYIQRNDGIDTGTSYPYFGEESACQYRKEGRGATDHGYSMVSIGNENQLMKAVATVGPIAVAIDASHMSFHSYHSGVYLEPSCTERPNHAVLIVGYGTDKESGLDYWQVKNSWGESWGMNGYIKMARNKRNHCCIACHALYPLI